MNSNREAALFALALEKPAAERNAFLKVVCGDDAALCQRLEVLLAAHDKPEGPLAEAMPAAPATMKIEFSEPLPDEAIGQTIGRYKIREKVGEGGCGVVYVAEQTEPVRRRVALKVIKLGMDTKQVVARFEAERQALAMMDHPNIAKVLDAGTTEKGRPYFIMELVRGIRITDYCDQANLSTKERLDLFIKVCQAIQHAHQKGIIHRDIKPSNILVTLHDGVPVPKVIDFGIAKATEGRLTDATVYTQLHQFIGTPAYMSPEQAEMSGLDIDTRSDIYSLGVLLYELLAGSTPFDGQELMSQGIDAMRKTIREKEPVRPSTKLSQTLVAADKVGRVAPRAPASGELASKDGAHGVTRPTTQSEEEVRASSRRLLRLKETITLLKGDLDWIVMKCLEKDRTRRYETANGIAADLKRHLNNEPVTARPPSKLYEFQKTVRRHKVGFAATAAIMVILGFGILASAWQAVRATRAQAQAEVEKQRADREAATANRVTAFMQQMLATANPQSSKSPDYTVRAMLDDFGSAIDAQFPDNPEVAAELHSTIGKAYWNMQQGAKAKPHVARALELRATAFGTDHEKYADSLVDYAESTGGFGNTDENKACEDSLRRALAIYSEGGVKGGRVIHALWALQMVYDRDRRYSEIEALVHAAQTEARQPPGSNYWELPAMNVGLISAKNQERKYAEAERIARESIAENTRLFGADYIQTAWVYRRLCDALLAQSKYREALDAATNAVAIMRKRVSPEQTWYGHQLLAVLDTLTAARRARALTNLFSSLESLVKLEALFQERLGSKPLLPDVRYDPVNVARSAMPQFPALYFELANEWTTAGKTNEATECRLKAITLIEQLETQSFGNPNMLSQLYSACMQHCVRQGDFGKAKQYRAKLLALKPLSSSSLNELSWSFATAVEPELRDGAVAVAFGEQAVAGTGRTNASALDTLAAAYAEAGQFTNAVRVQQEAISLLTKEIDKKEYATRLSLYQAAIPYRDPEELAQRIEAFLVSGNFAEAEPDARMCLTIREKTTPDDWKIFHAQSLLGGSLLGQKQYAEAEPLLLSGYEGMKQRKDKLSSGGKLRAQETLEGIIQLYEASGQTTKAVEWKKKLETLL
jgi:serine/threonine protein kinase/tetratricopeptide (TPR) repeat protein